jgi:hypothetical protein
MRYVKLSQLEHNTQWGKKVVKVMNTLTSLNEWVYPTEVLRNTGADFKSTDEIYSICWMLKEKGLVEEKTECRGASRFRSKLSVTLPTYAQEHSKRDIERYRIVESEMMRGIKTRLELEAQSYHNIQEGVNNGEKMD